MVVEIIWQFLTLYHKLMFGNHFKQQTSLCLSLYVNVWLNKSITWYIQRSKLKMDRMLEVTNLSWKCWIFSASLLQEKEFYTQPMAITQSLRETPCHLWNPNPLYSSGYLSILMCGSKSWLTVYLGFIP